MSSYEIALLKVGTPVKITAPGVWGEGTIGMVERAYRIRHGHPMYDIRSNWGTLHTYYAASQIEATEQANANV